MPLDMEVNVDIPSAEVINSKTIELVAAVHLLSDSKHHQFAEQWAKDMNTKLSEESKGTLVILSDMRLKGIELVEFILKDRIFDDVGVLIDAIERYSDIEFIYTFLGEEISIEKILETKKDKSSLNAFIEEIPFLTHSSHKGLSQLLYDTQAFRKSLTKLLSEVDCPEFHNKLQAKNELYVSSINDTKARLVNKLPLELGEEIMGKKCKVYYDFKEFYFVPSYFFSPHRIRFFNKTTQIIIFDISKFKTTSDEIGDKLSNVLKLISDRTRLEILKNLISGSSYGKLLAERLNLTTSTISHHLEQLKSINLVAEERIKNIKYFSANIEEIEKILKESRNYLFNNIEEEIDSDKK